MTLELFQVSVFLAAFSGLYLTVSTVTDETYREQFFAQVERQLERAVGVRAVYLARAGPRGRAAAGCTVTGTPLNAALPEKSSRSGSVRSLIETPATARRCAIRVPAAWWP